MRLRIAFGLAVVIALLAAACGTGDRSFTVTFAARDGVNALPVTIVDRTGTITLVEFAAGAPVTREHVSNVPGKPNELVVSWIGGTCDTATRLQFTRSGSGYEISEHTERAASCDLKGIPRAIALHLGAPIPAESVTFLPNL